MNQEELDILRNIKLVEAPNSLFNKVKDRIEMSKENVIPMHKVGVAASVVIGLMISQLIALNNLAYQVPSRTSQYGVTLITDNSLYNE